ncbi:hypothetical protein MTAT_29260 [Moorella thermoacetica]|uniref:Uncharacterized protein n=1 Tax=Neomoorella thermoacetica TaxID=1525 RepID=A0AAC9MTW6_NEOTH|nr:hypothetical protein [Moorella thermoacetica]AOQ23009.1 hypothetical protein Maut_00540 [Moorella thermoacetica]TYL07250.1 hypothetical protein MTAT_29260 [Moorella thermoacetica]
MVGGPLTEEEINELLAAYEELIAQIKEGKVLALTRREEVGNYGSLEGKMVDCFPNKRGNAKCLKGA